MPSHPATTQFNCWVCKNSKCFPLPQNTISLSILSQKFKILPLSVLANTLHWTPLLPSDSDFEHNFVNDKRWPLSCFLCRLSSAGLFSTVLVFIAQFFIFTALIRHLYHFPHWQRVHCSMYQTYTGKLLPAMILDIFFGSAIRLQHMWFVLVALHGLGTQNAERHLCFSSQNLELNLSTVALDW